MKLKSKFITFLTSMSLAFLSSFDVSAQVDFSSYTGTLDNLYGQGQSTITSGYDIAFTEITNQQDIDDGYYTFVSYEYDSAIDSYVAKYYDYTTGIRAGKTSSGRVNNATVGDVNTYYYSLSGNYGGAMYLSTVDGGNIVADFYGNTATWEGGAIYLNTSRTIASLTGDFVGNTATTNGGAISNSGTIVDIVGSFIDNTASSYGGAIYNANGIISGVTGDFINNKVISVQNTRGGAVSNSGSIGYLDGDFVGNIVETTNIASGGAVGNSGTVDIITGDFVGNGVVSTGNSGANGGAIYNNSGTITTGIYGDFIGNSAKISGTSGTNAIGGAIYNAGTGTIGEIYGDFIGNSASSTSTGLSGYAWGGAIYNASANMGKISGSFINNYAEAVSPDSFALGGAVYTGTDLTFKADGNDIEFTGNYTEDATSRGKTYNAIFINTGTVNTKKLTFDLDNGGGVDFNDQIEGGSLGIYVVSYTNTYGIDITGDGSDTAFNLNNSIINAQNVNVTDTTLTLGSTSVNGTETHGGFESPGTYKTALNLASSALNLDFSGYQTISLGSIVSDAASSIVFSANFGTGDSDSIDAATATGDIKIGDINVSGTVSVGDYITLFDNQYLNITNLDTYKLIYSGMAYTLSQTGGILEIVGARKLSFTEGYQPTLDRLEASGVSNIKSGYDIAFTEVATQSDIDAGNYAFAETLDGVTKYYNYTTTLRSVDPSLILTRIASTTVNADIEGYFLGLSGTASGGMIYNDKIIGDVYTDFIGNSVSTSGNFYGALVYNVNASSGIGLIAGDFINNSMISGNDARGGAVYNVGAIDGIVGNFIDNYMRASSGTEGLAVYNTGTINYIEGSFVGNVTEANGTSVGGGVIYNSGNIVNIDANFIGNKSISPSTGHDLSGIAIKNATTSSTMGTISGTFSDNYATAGRSIYGGAIYNNGIIGGIVADFVANQGDAGTSAYGGLFIT